MKKFGFKVIVSMVAVLAALAPVFFQQVGACAAGFGEIPAPDCIKEEE